MQPSLNDFQDHTRDLFDLAGLVTDPSAVGEVLERALDALRTLVPYDLAAIFRLKGELLQVVAAAGPLATPRVRSHRLHLSSLPSLKRVLLSKRPAAMRLEDHEEEGDPYEQVLGLPDGHSCMVVPLVAGDQPLGVITLDRSVCEPYSESTVQLAGVYGHIISLAMLFAEQAAMLNRYRHQLKEHNRLLLEEGGGAHVACQRLEQSRAPAMRKLVRHARQVATVDVPVLIQGETGTGKEVLAQAIHNWSARVDRPFVKLNCSALPENLVESELFGHVKGAFSGADRERPGRFVTANGGTLLLDELGDMPLSAQAKLLRVLQEGTFEPVGSDKTLKVDVRVIAATHVNLEEAIRAGRFREDLYYRLAVFPLHIPALRERSEDIVCIAEQFLEGEHRRSGRGPWELSPEAQETLEQAPWPGNVRELINALERATIQMPAGRIEPELLLFRRRMDSPSGGLLPPGRSPLERMPKLEGNSPTEPEPMLNFETQERRYFERLLAHTGGRIYGVGGAAALAGLKPTTLRSKLEKLGIR
ncbi:MAG: sigma 54-interacting transcriptional regulator [Myxococcota bacterium]